MQRWVPIWAPALALGLALGTWGCGEDGRPGGSAGSTPQGGAAGAAGGDDGGGGGGGSTVDATYDVVVVGAGSGGVAAAIAAARQGATVLLTEPTDWIGGQMTAASVPNMDGGNQPPGGTGIYDELRQRIRDYYADTTRFPPSGKSISTCYWSAASTCFEPHVGRQILADMLADAGVTVALRTTVASVVRSGEVVTGLTLSDGTTVTSELVVDATEEGDLLPLSGARYRVGNSLSTDIDDSACIQSLTYVGVVRRYDGGVPPELRIDAPPPGYETYRPLFASIVAVGGSSSGFPIDYPVSWPFHNAYRGLPDSLNLDSYTGQQPALITKTAINWANDYPGYAMVDDQAQWVDTLKVTYLEDPTVRAEVDCEAKLMTLGFVYYVQSELGQSDWSIATEEGFDTAYQLDRLCPQIPSTLKPLERHMSLRPYVRESRRIVPVDTLTAAEIRRVGGMAEQNFADSIAVGDYPTDLHNCRADTDLEADLGEVAADSSGGGPFQVPITALLPETIDGLLPAEKNIGVSRLAAGAIRLQPITMATGQAAGTMAAMAAERGVEPRALRVVDVQQRLLEQRSALSRHWFDDVPVTSPYWEAVQLASTYEIMIGVGAGQFGVHEALGRAAGAVLTARLFSLDLSNPPTVATFDDVPSSHWAFAAVEALVAAGITSGCSAAPPQYCPAEPLTRAQLAAFVVRGLGIDPATAPGTPLFEDVPSSHPMFAYVQLAASEGLVAGCSQSPSQFCPAADTIRGAAAQATAAVLRR